MSEEARARNPVETTQRSLRLVEALEESDGAGVTALADRLGMSKSVVHNHLSTLREAGYVLKRDGEYVLSLKFLELGGHTRKRMALYDAARKPVTQLAAETGELVNLMTESQGLGAYIYRAKGDRAVDLNTYTGFRTHLHTTALGKCIMARMPEKRWRGIVERRGLPAATENTITDRSALGDRLAEVDEQGYAIDTSERLEGVRCVAAPVEDDDGVVGAISVSAPEGRISLAQAEEETQRQVRDTANVVGLELRY